MIIVLSVLPGMIAFLREGGPQHVMAAYRAHRARRAQKQ